jgi:hypothetical protein
MLACLLQLTGRALINWDGALPALLSPKATIQQTVTKRVATPAVFDEHALDALAGNVRQLVLVDEGHLGVLRFRHPRGRC